VEAARLAAGCYDLRRALNIQNAGASIMPTVIVIGSVIM
jgi:hypothetical protein